MSRPLHKRGAYNLARRKNAVPVDEWARRLTRDRKARQKNPNCFLSYKKSDLKRHYGLTLEDWENMFEAQDRACASCGSPHSGRLNGQWCTDHDHTTGLVRGILCNGCNLAAGAMKDDPERCHLLAKYLERARKRASD